MPMVSKDYQRLVLDEINAGAGLAKPVRAGLLERLFRKRAGMEYLHPNPEDEFCDEKIGPNDEILSRYEQEIRHRLSYKEPPIAQRLSVEKTTLGGYMLLDGHHRWMAAHRCGVKRLPIKVMNVTPVESILSGIAKSDRKIIVSFDLDEVLLAENDVIADTGTSRLRRLFAGKRLRKHAALLIRELQKLGMDVWVYTGQYHSEAKLKALFRVYRAEVDGMVCGLRNNHNRTALREAFAKKYEMSLHVDNESIIAVNTRTHEYDIHPLNASGVNWAARVLQTVKEIESVQAYLPKAAQGEQRL